MSTLFECVANDRHTKCHPTCRECSPHSLCHDENACTKCHPRHYKVSEDPDDRLFKCSNSCDTRGYYYKDNYCYCKPTNNLTVTLDSSMGSSSKIYLQTNTETVANILSHSTSSVQPYIFLICTCFIVIILLLIILLLNCKENNQKRKAKHFYYMNSIKVATNRHAPDSTLNLITDSDKKRCIKPFLKNETVLPYFSLEEINLKDFKKIRTLGGGQFSNVFQGTLRGIPVAIKVAVKGEEAEGRKSIHKEMQIYGKVSHTNIVPALGVHLGVENMLFLALRNQDLKTYFELYSNTLDYPRLKQYCIQVANAMEYLHRNKILHCDLKIDNILVKDDKGEEIEISDFGCAIDLNDDCDHKSKCTETHMAYELLKKSITKNYAAKPSTASDVWSFAVTAWQIFQRSGQIPPNFWFAKDIVSNYEQGKKLPTPAMVSEKYWHYIFYACFDLVPETRPSMHHLHNMLTRKVFTKKLFPPTSFRF